MGQSVESWLKNQATKTIKADKSTYFTIQGFTVRYSDHHSGKSPYNVGIVKTPNKEYICVGAPLGLMIVLNKPKDVKFFIETYIMALKCNHIKERKRKGKEDKHQNAAKDVQKNELHMDIAQSVIEQITDESFNEVMNARVSFKEVTSTSFNAIWQSRIRWAYNRYPERHFLLLFVLNRIKLLSEPAKLMVWKEFEKKVSN